MGDGQGSRAEIESAEIRERFIKFFEEKGHTRMPSWPLILKDDPSVLFTSAGMQPLVPYFLGKKQPPAKRIVAVQKVFRATDIEEVGRDGYHQTFWEMLGNFGIGDYWKKEAIEWGWELLTKVFGIDGGKLVATVHHTDDEAYQIWTKTLALLPPEKVFRLGDEANFWAPGPTGLCGPDSEVFIDKVEVQKAEYTPQDASDAVLAALQRQALEVLGVDLDEMAPTKSPSPLQTLEVEGTIGKLKAAGKTSEATFLTQLLHEAQSLQPASSIPRVAGTYRTGQSVQRGGLHAHGKWNTRLDRSALQLGQRVKYSIGRKEHTGVLTKSHANGAAWDVTGKAGGQHPERTETIYADQIKAVEEPG